MILPPHIFTSQNAINAILVVCSAAAFFWLFSLQSLQQDVETQKTMVRHQEKPVQQVDLMHKKKYVRKCSIEYFVLYPQARLIVLFLFVHFLFVCLFVRFFVSCPSVR